MTKTDVTSPPASETRDSSGDAGILAFAEKVLRAESSAIEDACERLGSDFVRAVRAILACEQRVCVTGVGKAGLIGNKIQATLASTGTLAYSLHPVEALHGDLGMIHGGDVVVALSKSGSSELVELLPRLRELGCFVVLLTAKPDSPASAHADAVLHIGSVPEACPLGLAPSSSTAAMLALGDALALSVMELRSVRPEQYASWHPGGALGRMLLTVEQVMRTGADCPKVAEDATLDACYEVILEAPRRAGAAAVVDGKGHLSGIITHGDFFRLFKTRESVTAKTVAEVMTRKPKCVSRGDRVTRALELMRKHAIDELPVVDDAGLLVGLVDIQDLINRGFSPFETVA